MQKSQVACSKRERMKGRTRDYQAKGAATEVVQESAKRKFYYIMHYQDELLKS